MQWKRIDPVLLPKAEAEKELCTLRLNKQAKNIFSSVVESSPEKFKVLWNCLREKQKHANNTCLCCPPDGVQKLQAETAAR